MKMADFMLLSCGVLLNALAQLGLKAATLKSGAIRLDPGELTRGAAIVGSQPAFWAAILAYGLSVVVWIVGLSRVPVSQAYPLLSMGYVINALFAWWLLGEAITPGRAAGIVTVLIGIVLIART